MEKYGFIIIPENLNENNSYVKNTSTSISGNIRSEDIPLKTTEMSEIKNQVNKND